MKKNLRRPYISALRRMPALVLAFMLLVAVLAGCAPAVGEISSSPTASSAAPQPAENRVAFSAVGDNLIHTGIYLQAAARAGGDGYDFSYAYDPMRYFLDQFDVNWINQETIINDAFEPSSYPLFSSPGALGHAAYDAGWRIFSLSNNHIYDKGAGGVAATREFWATMPDDVRTPGLFTNTDDDSGIALHEANGITFAYLSFTENTNGIPQPPDVEAYVVLTSQTDIIERLVRRARELADVVMVALHWGVEYSFTPTDAQRQLAKDVGEWGADVIIGGHPHVIQPVEWITNETDGRKVLVAYSLGNFLSAQANARNMVGLAMTMDFVQAVEPDGTRHPVQTENVKFYPTVTHYDWGYNNVRTYMFRDYTDELAAVHGCHERGDSFSLEYIQNLVTEYVPAEFLMLD